MSPTKTDKKKAARKGVRVRTLPKAHILHEDVIAQIEVIHKHLSRIENDVREGDVRAKVHVLNNSVMNLRNQYLEGHSATRERLTAMERKLDLVLSANSLLQELDAKKEEQGKWVPKKGDRVTFPETQYPALVAGVVTDVQTRYSGEALVTVDWAPVPSINTHWASEIRLATPEEIESSAYGEREGLLPNDCCECSPEQRDELYAIAHSGGVAGTNFGDKSAPNAWWGIDLLMACTKREGAAKPSE